MKLFIKKLPGASLRSLNEEEIQKKLYGTFHKNTISQNPSVTFNTSKSVPFTRPKPLREPSNFIPNLKAAYAKISQKLKTFPWKFAAIVVALLIFSIYTFQFLSGAIQDFSKKRAEAKQAAKIAAVQAHIAQANVEAAKPVPATVKKIDLASPNDKPLSLPGNKSYYAVQICTYQKESDAKNLSQELIKSNFSAFYLKMQGSANKSPYYVVFLGKNESYAGANDKLKEFRRSEQYQKFPDAFIRSI